MTGWIYKYYVEPIVLDTGYNPVNTLTWAVLLGVALLLLVKLARRLEISIDEKFIIYTVPYILAGSSLRVIEDADLVSAPTRYLLITPFIYLLVFCVTIAALLICGRISPKNFYKGYAAVGLLWTAFNFVILAGLGIELLWVPLALLCIGSGITGLLYLSFSRANRRFLDNRCNLLILYSHMLDASSTYIGVDWLGYHEKHVLPTMLIDLFGTAIVMFPLKLVVLLPVLALIDESMKGEAALRNLTKLALLTLGLAPATRNMLRMTLGI